MGLASRAYSLMNQASRPIALVLDLDQTLVDTRPLKKWRDSRMWKEACAGVPTCDPIAGLDRFRSVMRYYRVAIVTNTPSTYAQTVLRHFDIPYKVLIGYHDVQARKPHPEPIQLALQELGVHAAAAWSFGDHPHDVTSAKSAGLALTVAIGVASDFPELLRASCADRWCWDLNEATELLERSECE